ncbi:DHH family phosphoesterase [Facklamia languida]
MINLGKLKEFFHNFHALEISWQIYSLLAIYATITIIALWLEWRIGCLLILMLVAVILFFCFNIRHFIRDLTIMAGQMSKNVALAQEYAIYHAPIGVLLYDQLNRVTWVNPAMQDLFAGKDLIGETIENIDSKLAPLFNQTSLDQWQEISLDSGYYRFLHQAQYRALYLYDITHDIAMQQMTQQTTVVMGNLFLEDYDDLLYAMNDEESARFESDLIVQLNRWADDYHIFLKQTDEDHFLLLLNRHALSKLEEEKFKSFNEIRQHYHDQNIPISMALALAFVDDIKQDMLAVNKQAKANLDLALGRGGDQVVVRSINGKATFYGGKSATTEKRSDIRAKMFFKALKSAVQPVDNVVIAGHRFPDTDSLGSALGVYQIVKNYHREARILIEPNELNHDIKELLSNDHFQDNWDALFLTHETVEDFLQDKTLFILVDHHRPSISEAQTFMEPYDKIVIDHHRRSEEFPDQTVLTYIEPSASSTAELLTEYFQFVEDTNSSLDKMTATALLAGIIVDTNQFSLRTGSRTFQSAAYLKAQGADTLEIQYLLKESLATITARNRLIERMQIEVEGYAITMGEEDQVLDSMTAAQTADEMLGIDQVEASFVIYRRSSDQIGISARSLGNINVQTLMEALGGGGHLSNAATQIKGKTISDAYQDLIQVIKKREDEG